MAKQKNYFKAVQDYKKQHPRSTHQAACTAVSRERKKTMGAVKKKAAPKKAAAKKTTAKAGPKRTIKAVSTGSVSSYMTGAKKLLAEKLGRLEAGKFMAKKKSDKMRFTKDIRNVKTDLRKFL